MTTSLTGLSTSLTFDENTVNGTPQIIDSSVTFTSSDTNFKGSQVTVSGLLPEDTVSIHNQGTGDGQISYAGGIVSYGGTAIGTVSGGAGSTLTVTLNAHATAAALEVLIENLTYANTSDNPAASRTLTLSFLPAPLSLTEKTGADNPLNYGTGFNHSKAALADVDGDGDLDAVVGGRDGAHPIGGTLKYFKNTGTATLPQYEQQTTAETNPFYGIDTGWDSAPSLADLDKDGDLDAVVRTGGTFKYFKNTGTATSPQYVEQVTAETNPFDGIDGGGNSAFTLADVDGDGDIDAVVGRGDGTLWYFKNTGSTIAPQYVQQTGSDDLFNGIDAGDNSAPALADVDRDGDLDAVVGEYSGTLKYFENMGSAIAPQYVEQTGTDNPFDGIDVGSMGDYNYSTPTLADLDGDGNIDALVGEYWGFLKYYQGMGGGAITPVAVEQTGTANPFNGLDVGSVSSPTFADIDGDDDLDAVVGASDGTLKYYKNTGNATTPVYVVQTGTNNPFNGINPTDFPTPTFADVDGDGDLDAIAGDGGGPLRYYKNMGTATSPQYVEQTTAETNPFHGIDVGSLSAPTLADVDRDGDLDAVVGENLGTLKYYKNMGTATDPEYVEQTTAETNPFYSVNVSFNSTPTLADVDQDGDLDAVVGAQDGTLRYYKNTGSGAPLYEEQIGADNPFDSIDAGGLSTPNLVDLARDGDLEAVVGAQDGTLRYYKLMSEFPVIVTVAAENDAPVAWGESVTVKEDATTAFENVLVNDSDIDGPALLVKSVHGVTIGTGTKVAGTYGTLTISNDGRYSYTANKADALIKGEIKTDAFTCTVTDGTLMNTATLTVTIQGQDETLVGTRAANTLTGGRGADILKGQAGNDILKGMSGNDWLYGGTGNDTLAGGTGSGSRDTFVFDTALNRNVDRITDFERTYDQIFLNDAVFRGLGTGSSAGTPLSTGLFVANAHGEATRQGKAQIVYETDTGKLFYDVDGTGQKAAIQFATLSGKPALSRGDFELI